MVKIGGLLEKKVKLRRYLLLAPGPQPAVAYAPWEELEEEDGGIYYLIMHTDGPWSPQFHLQIDNQST